MWKIAGYFLASFVCAIMGAIVGYFVFSRSDVCSNSAQYVLMATLSVMGYVAMFFLWSQKIDAKSQKIEEEGQKN